MFTEADLEDEIYSNPDIVLDAVDFLKNIVWTKRQLTVPSGRIDIFGFGVSRTLNFVHPVIVELKNEGIKEKHLTQMVRYAADIENAMCGVHYNITQDYGAFDIALKPIKFIVFQGGVPTNILHEAYALEINLLSFVVEKRIKLSGHEFIRSYAHRLDKMERELFWELHDQVKNVLGVSDG